MTFYGEPIRKTETAKIIGILFDAKLNGKNPLNHLAEKYEKSLPLFKFLTRKKSRPFFKKTKGSVSEPCLKLIRLCGEIDNPV